MKDERTKILEEFVKLANHIIDLSLNWNCKGIPTVVLKTWLNIMRAVFKEFFAEVDNMSIDKACERYAITIPTLRTRIEELNLSPMVKIEDKCRVMVPKDTIEALDKYYDKKDKESI